MTLTPRILRDSMTITNLMVECVTLKISRHVYTSPLPTGVTTLGVTKVLEFTVRHV